MGNCLGDPGPNMDPMMMYDESSVAIGQNQPLSSDVELWTSDIPLTEGQLRGKRDTFWETAPAYDGRREIWDALKAACEAAEEGDIDLAQAILNGANVSLPRGRLIESYDELGNRYVVPKYCISKPMNMVGLQGPTNDLEDDDDSQDQATSSTKLLQEHPPPSTSRDPHQQQQQRQFNQSGSSTSSSKSNGRQKTSKSKNKSSSRESRVSASTSGTAAPSQITGSDANTTSSSNSTVFAAGPMEPMIVKVRLSTQSKDRKISLTTNDRVRDLKRKLERDYQVPAKSITMLYSGRVLNNGTLVKGLGIPKGFIIQAIVNQS